MVTKKFIKSRKVYQLTFEFPVTQTSGNVTSMAVAGDFNNWHITANPMNFNKKKQVYQAVVEVINPGTYHYRYVINSKNWINDWKAEGYMSNGYGEDNCLVRVQP